MSLRKKINIVILAVYWPTLFLLAHIPIPQVVYKAQVSDKSLHFLAYMILSFLLWFSFCPETRPTVRKKTFWWVIVTLIFYSAADEVLQSYVGRTCDLRDFLANLTGISAGLVLALFTFWPGLVIVSATAIFLMINVARANVNELIPFASIVFYALSYGLFTIIWINYLHRSRGLRVSPLRWIVTVLVTPIALLVMVEFSSGMLGRYFGPWRAITSLSGIFAAVLVHAIVKSLSHISGETSVTNHP